GREGARKRGADSCGLAPGERPARLHAVVERAAIEILEREVDVPPVFAGREDGHDPLVFQGFPGARLAEKALPDRRFCGGRERGSEELERAGLVGLPRALRARLLLGEKDDSHAAMPQLALDREAADRLPFEGAHARGQCIYWSRVTRVDHEALLA